MNILIAVTQLRHAYGGVCTHIIDLCKAFCAEHHVVLVADGSDYDAQIRAIPNLTYIELPFDSLMTSKKAIFTCAKQLIKICKEHHIQIIHLHGQRLIPSAWLVRLATGIPFLWTNHINAIPQQEILAKMWKLMRFPIISVSSDLKEQLSRELHISKKHVYVVNNGVDLATLLPLSEHEKSTIRCELEVDPDAFVISEVARLNYVKGQHLLVRAVHAVSQRYPDIKFQILLAGNGDMQWFYQHVMDYAKENNLDCKYLGFCSPRIVYGISNLAIQDTKYEGFPLSCIEAMAMCCPVLRSRSPGYLDVQDVVLSCEYEDLQSLIDQLEYAITHRKQIQQLAQKAQSQVASRFTKEITAQNTLAVYRNILRK